MLSVLCVFSVTICVAVIGLLINAVILSKHIFVCPKCGCKTEFPMHRLIFITHFENEYSIPCPQCRNKIMIVKE